MLNNVYSLLVPKVPFINLLHCIVLSVSGRNPDLQVQFALHYHLSTDRTSVVQLQLRRNPVGPQQFSHIQLRVQYILVMTKNLETYIYFHTYAIVYS
jgi:hypothetical protein